MIAPFDEVSHEMMMADEWKKRDQCGIDRNSNDGGPDVFQANAQRQMTPPHHIAAPKQGAL